MKYLKPAWDACSGDIVRFARFIGGWMPPRWLIVAGLCLLTTLFLLNSVAQETAAWHDPSPHRVLFVTVEKGVRLEVLDWGGSGRAVVLLAGYQTAHEYDEIAPKLAAFCHVY